MCVDSESGRPASPGETSLEKTGLHFNQYGCSRCRSVYHLHRARVCANPANRDNALSVEDIGHVLKEVRTGQGEIVQNAYLSVLVSRCQYRKRNDFNGMLTFNVNAAPMKMPGASYSLWTLNEIFRSRKDLYNCSWG
jgi:hypothetical protein